MVQFKLQIDSSLVVCNYGQAINEAADCFLLFAYLKSGASSKTWERLQEVWFSAWCAVAVTIIIWTESSCPGSVDWCARVCVGGVYFYVNSVYNFATC